ncbi:MAG: hypothetical protein HUU41_21735 [Bryobacteraceae bacterium]|nr:hypothetical protein [Bryobacterales bacterium]NUN03737.1 hypothetical protein [Bryobacteraceae bacterium]
MDHALELLFFWTPERKLTGIGVNVACPSQVVESQYYVSADFWNDAREELDSDNPHNPEFHPEPPPLLAA